MPEGKIAKRILLQRYTCDMALQFNCEPYPRSLVDLSYQSSEEDMDIDSITSTQDVLNSDSDDDDIQVLACYRLSPEFPQQLIAGRAITTEITECLNDLNLPSSELVESATTISEPCNSLVDWFIGNPPASHIGQSISDHPIAHCSKINPVLESPLLPPLIDQQPTDDFRNDDYQSQVRDSWTNNPHITGLGISVSGTCG